MKIRQSEEMHQFVKESKESYLDKAFPKIWDKFFTVKYTEFIDSTISFFGEISTKSDDFLK